MNTYAISSISLKAVLKWNRMIGFKNGNDEENKHVSNPVRSAIIHSVCAMQAYRGARTLAVFPPDLELVFGNFKSQKHSSIANRRNRPVPPP